MVATAAGANPPRASERGAPGETREPATNIALALPRRESLSPCLCVLATSVEKNRQVLPSACSALHLAWYSFLATRRLVHRRLSPRDPQPVGAPVVRASGLGPLLEIQTRGSWRTFESVRKGAKLAQLSDQLLATLVLVGHGLPGPRGSPLSSVGSPESLHLPL